MAVTSMNLKSPTFTGESYQELLERRPRVRRHDQTLDPDSVLQETKLHQGESLKIEWEDTTEQTWVETYLSWKFWCYFYIRLCIKSLCSGGLLYALILIGQIKNIL